MTFGTWVLVIGSVLGVVVVVAAASAMYFLRNRG